MSIVKVSHLSHSYNGKRTWAVRDANFEIKARGIVGLLGSNGAGKSTTMNIICGVLNQTEGTVLINGADIRRNPEEAKRQLGFLPQDPPVYLDLTVDEYLEHCARLRLMPKSAIRAAVEEVKEKVNITHFSKRLLKNLSGGYRQRVGIAQAIIHKPHLVVMDEPTVGLDPNQVVEVRNLVQEIAIDRAVIFSTHILSEVDLMCKEVIMIENGRMVFSGSLEAFRKVETPDSILATFESHAPLQELEKISGVTKVEHRNDQRVRITFDGTAGMTTRIMETALQQRWGLREISYEQKSLEAIFTRFSRDGYSQSADGQSLAGQAKSGK
jgi:ABC-2 type transport system ATP-binding protein